ncbi:hypothetical protein [Dokdonella soli]|uniref:Uncharacterized protein n=1 Tax=Dokdonella soli TaxID=529810 RepID=A0ABN1IBR8_9GAMM
MWRVNDPDSSEWMASTPFGDSAYLRNQMQAWRLTLLQADFVRCLALSAWAKRRPVRLMSLELPRGATLDDCLLVCLRRCGWSTRDLGDEALRSCWELRIEFVAARAGLPAHYRVGPSYHDRLRLDLLLHTWERLSYREINAAIVEMVSAKLADATASFSQRLALPLPLLHGVVAERRAERAAERRSGAERRPLPFERSADEIRHLAITHTLESAAVLERILRRYGTAPMRTAQRHWARSHPTPAQVEFEGLRANLCRELWAPACEGD